VRRTLRHVKFDDGVLLHGQSGAYGRGAAYPVKLTGRRAVTAVLFVGLRRGRSVDGYCLYHRLLPSDSRSFASA